MDISLLASIQLNYKDGGGDVVVFVADILEVNQLAKGETGCAITFRDGRPPKLVAETVSAVQTAINALWDEYAT